jgi:hypothetical protein
VTADRSAFGLTADDIARDLAQAESDEGTERLDEPDEPQPEQG